MTCLNDAQFAELLALLASLDGWIEHPAGLRLDDVIACRERLAKGLGKPPRG